MIRTRPVRTEDEFSPDFGRLFKRFDSNKDGIVSFEEFFGDRQVKAVPLTKQFKKRDSNKDSRLTVGELAR